MRSEFLPFHVPQIGEEEIRAVVETLRSGWLTTGPRVGQFEKEFAEYVGASHAVALNSGTAALHLALEAAGITEGDEVLVPTMTFAATAQVVLHLRAKPVLVDSQRDTLNIDPELIQKAITNETKAIIPVHHGGHPCDMARFSRSPSGMTSGSSRMRPTPSRRAMAIKTSERLAMQHVSPST